MMQVNSRIPQVVRSVLRSAAPAIRGERDAGGHRRGVWTSILGRAHLAVG